MTTLTIFTPTFNRAYCLHKLYNSLLRQSSSDFEWLVIDDGSTDNTRDLVEQWIEENKIIIRYQYKENGGMHTGHNLAIRLITTELNVCVDSDDYLVEDAVENIINCWREKSTKNHAGMLGLNCFENRQLVSSGKFPDSVLSGKYSELKTKYNIVGDVKFIYSTDILRNYPNYPVFEDEKFVPLGFKYRLIDRDYDLLFLNKIVCVVNYLDDGSTLNIVKQYYKNPKGFAYSRLVTMNNMHSGWDSFIQTIHFVAESMLSRKSIWLDDVNKLRLTLALPFGFALYFYILYKNKR